MSDETGKLLEFRLPLAPPDHRQIRNEMAIEALETLLEQARAGLVISVAAAYERPDGQVACFWTSPEDKPRLGFGIALLSHRFMSSAVATSEETNSVPTG